MTRRIIGQCGQSDFDDIEHIVDLVDRAEDLDFSTLTTGQQYVMKFFSNVHNKGISWLLMRGAVKRVLFWQDERGRTYIEIKFRTPKSKETYNMVQKFNELWRI